MPLTPNQSNPQALSQNTNYFRAKTKFDKKKTDDKTIKNYMPEITSKDDPAHLKKWMRQHYFDLQNSYDLELIRTLRKS